MDRSSNLNRTKLTNNKCEELETSEELEGENYYRVQLEMAEQMHATERPEMLSQILDHDLAMPQHAMREILTKISFATFDLEDNEVNQINEKKIKKFPEMVEGRTIDKAANDVKGIAEIMLTATIIRSSLVRSHLQSKLAEAAGKIGNQLYAEYMFDALINTYNLTQCEDIHKLITTAAPLIGLMPRERQLQCLIDLYRALPDQAEERLACLEAMMNETAKIPESHDSMTVLSMLNQEIYKLRIENN